MVVSDKIRPIKPEDIPALKTVIDANELFPSDMLDEMIAGYFQKRRVHNEFWFTYKDKKANCDRILCARKDD